MQHQGYTVLGSALSPFTWKVIALLDHAGLPYRFLPPAGGTMENLRIMARKEALVRGLLPLSWPRKSPLDEYPLVPFLFGPNGENLYDSTAIAHWLDRQGFTSTAGSLVLPQQSASSFVVSLIDNYADEFLLYVVHHNRWVLSARDNTAGERLGRELRPVMGPLATTFGRQFARRQVRRLPYLFSVAEAGTEIEGLPDVLQPPHRTGFPATHKLLDQAFIRLLDALEKVYSKRGTLLGSHFTLADAAIYGALSMNLDDPGANAVIQHRAPATHQWLIAIRDHQLPEGHNKTDILETDLTSLIQEAVQLYVPLQQQNEAAWQQFLTKAQKRWNEAAFNRGEALYSGELHGYPFRSVVKTFQVASWRALCAQWQGLPSVQRSQVLEQYPALEVFK